MGKPLHLTGISVIWVQLTAGTALAQVPPSAQSPEEGPTPTVEVAPPALAPEAEIPVAPGSADVHAEPTPSEPPAVAVAPSQTAAAAVQPVAFRPPVSDAVEDEPASDGNTKKGKKGPKLDVGMRVIGGFEYQKKEEDEEATYGFDLRQVRVSMKLQWKKRWRTRATVDFSDGIDPGSGVQYLRTAVLEYRYAPELQVVVGRYKRPFSHLELQSTGELPILNRGLLNGLIVEDAAWGDRGIGAMVSGKHKSSHLGWHLSLTNPSPDNLATQGLDVIGRVTWKPFEELHFGVHGGNKYLDFEEGRKHFQAVGGDVTLRVAGLEWQLEGMVADSPWRGSVAYGGTTLISYSLPLTKHLKLQPVVFGEYADANSEYEKNESVRVQGGINLVIRDRFRIMPQVRITRALGEPLRSAPPSSPEYAAINPWSDATQASLQFSLAL